jgi:hypothetical protein
MIRKFTALLAAFAFAAASFTPAAADARDRRHDGYYDGGRHHGYYRRHRDNDGDAVAAGVVGLVLGLAIGSLASQPRQPQARCTPDHRYCEPPPGYYEDRRGYERDGYYDPRDDHRGSAYEQEYGELEGAPYAEGSYDPAYDDQRQPQCVRRERQWDRYAQRYLMVDVPC